MTIKYVDESELEIEVKKDGLTIVDAYGVGWGPCEILSKVLDNINKDFPFVNILKIDVKQNKSFGKKNKILGVPTVFYYKDGEKLEKNTNGRDYAGIAKYIQDKLYR